MNDTFESLRADNEAMKTRIFLLLQDANKAEEDAKLATKTITELEEKLQLQTDQMNEELTKAFENGKNAQAILELRGRDKFLADLRKQGSAEEKNLRALIEGVREDNAALRSQVDQLKDENGALQDRVDMLVQDRDLAREQIRRAEEYIATGRRPSIENATWTSEPAPAIPFEAPQAYVREAAAMATQTRPFSFADQSLRQGQGPDDFGPA